MNSGVLVNVNVFISFQAITVTIMKVVVIIIKMASSQVDTSVLVETGEEQVEPLVKIEEVCRFFIVCSFVLFDIHSYSTSGSMCFFVHTFYSCCVHALVCTHHILVKYYKKIFIAMSTVICCDFCCLGDHHFVFCDQRNHKYQIFLCYTVLVPCVHKDVKNSMYTIFSLIEFFWRGVTFEQILHHHVFSSHLIHLINCLVFVAKVHVYFHLFLTIYYHIFHIDELFL